MCFFKYGNWLVSSFPNCEMNSFNFILNALMWFIKLGNNLFLPCSLICTWTRWSVTLTKISDQILSHKRARSSGGSFFFLPEHHEQLASRWLLVTQKGFVRNKKPIKYRGGYFALLRSQKAPVELIQCAKLGACAIGWPPCPTAGTTGDCDKTWREIWEQAGGLHIGS